MASPTSGSEAQVSWVLDEITIYGTLTRPPGAGPFPTVVFVAGSGPTDRDWNSPLIPGTNGRAALLAQTLTAQGYLTLRYDKRASGPHVMENVQRLAGAISMQGHTDELAGAIRLLAGHPEVNPRRLFIARALPWFAEHLVHSSWRAWVVVAAEGEIVGHVFLHLIEKLPNPIEEAEHLGYLTNLFVLPAYRGWGLGRRLLDTAITACPPELVDRLILWPSPRSRALYERAGFLGPASAMERSLHQHTE